MRNIRILRFLELLITFNFPGQYVKIKLIPQFFLFARFFTFPASSTQEVRAISTLLLTGSPVISALFNTLLLVRVFHFHYILNCFARCSLKLFGNISGGCCVIPALIKKRITNTNFSYCLAA